MYKKLTLMALVATTALAADWCDCGEWAVGAEALYWKPAQCQIPWGFIDTDTNDPDTVTRQDLLLQADYEWGVRAFGRYTQDCFELQLSYLYLRPTDSVHARNTGTTMTIIGDENVDAATARLRFRYQNLDLRATKFLHHSCACDFGAYANARWVDLDFDLKVREEDGPEGYEQRNSLQGGALGVGVTGRFDLCGCFDIGGRFGIMSVMAERKLRKARLDESSTSFEQRVPGSSTGVLPAVEFQLGLGYDWECGCVDVRIEIGYELDYYFSALRFPLTTQDEEDTDLPAFNCENIGFGGPYLGLTLGF